jgi:hypothetical protein
MTESFFEVGPNFDELHELRNAANDITESLERRHKRAAQIKGDIRPALAAGKVLDAWKQQWQNASNIEDMRRLVREGQKAYGKKRRSRKHFIVVTTKMTEQKDCSSSAEANS